MGGGGIAAWVNDGVAGHAFRGRGLVELGERVGVVISAQRVSRWCLAGVERRITVGLPWLCFHGMASAAVAAEEITCDLRTALRGPVSPSGPQSTASTRVVEHEAVRGAQLSRCFDAD